MDLFASLVGNLPEPRIKAMIEADNLLEALDVSRHQAHINVILGTEEYDNIIDGSEAIEFAYHESVLVTIAVYGVRLIDDTHSLQDLVAILGGIHSMAEPENLDILEEALETYEDSNEILAYILGELREQDMYWFMGKLDRVDGDLISRIRDVINSMEMEEEDEAVTAEIINNYKEYMKGRPPEAGIIATRMTEVFTLPVSFNAMVVDLQKELVALDVPDFMEELYQLSILADNVDDFEENVSRVARAFSFDEIRLIDIDRDLVRRGIKEEI